MIATTPTTPPDEMAQRLERLVRELVSCYEGLVSLAESRLEAIRSSNAQNLAACIRQENQLVQAIAGLERERSEVVTALAHRMGSEKESATKITWIARRLKGPEGERITTLCDTLKRLAQQLGSLNEVARIAAEHLANHMTGLLQAVSRHLNHAKTYSRSGSVEAGARVVSSLDIST